MFKVVKYTVKFEFPDNILLLISTILSRTACPVNMEKKKEAPSNEYLGICGKQVELKQGMAILDLAILEESLTPWCQLQKLKPMKEIMKKILVTALCILFSFLIFSGEDAVKNVDSKSFLEKARRPPVQESWAKLAGKTMHRRADKESQEFPIYLGLRFTPERILAQVFVNENENYNIGQQYCSAPGGTSVIATNKNPGGKSALGDFGLRPEDLTLSFMYWDFVSELDKDSVKGRECRVFILKSPTLQERVKIFIDAETCFPVKAEWIREDKENKGKEEIYRTIEITSFRKESDFWFVDSFVIYGPGWKTKVEFSDIAAGLAKDGIPEDIFRKNSP